MGEKNCQNNVVRIRETTQCFRTVTEKNKNALIKTELRFIPWKCLACE